MNTRPRAPGVSALNPRGGKKRERRAVRHGPWAAGGAPPSSSVDVPGSPTPVLWPPTRDGLPFLPAASTQAAPRVFFWLRLRRNQL